MPRFTYNAKAYLQRQDDQKSAPDGFEFKAEFPYWVILRGCARNISTPSQYQGGGRSLRFLEFSSLSWQCDHTEGGKMRRDAQALTLHCIKHLVHFYNDV